MTRSRLSVSIVLILMFAAAVSACATPRERSLPQRQPEPEAERRSPTVTDVQQQSELADLTRDVRTDASAVTAADSLQMSGSGDVEAVHELAPGLYQCSIDLRDNLEAERPALFRVHFVSRHPLNPGVISTTQSDWATSFELLLVGNEQTSSSRVEVRLTAAPASEWTFQCDRRAELVRSGPGSRSAILLALPSNNEPRGNLSSSSGRGSGVALISALPDVYTCRVNVNGNFADDGGAARFAVKLGEQTIVTVETSTWSGEVEYELTGEGAGDVPPYLTVIAGESASWDIVCSPKTSERSDNDQ